MNDMERFPADPTEYQEQVVESVMLPDGSFNEAVLAQQYGLGAEEASQVVTFGSWQGTLAQALDDERCPVGDMMRTAYRDEGLDGVDKKLQGLALVDSRFKVEISDATRERERSK